MLCLGGSRWADHTLSQHCGQVLCSCQEGGWLPTCPLLVLVAPLLCAAACSASGRRSVGGLREDHGTAPPTLCAKSELLVSLGGTSSLRCQGRKILSASGYKQVSVLPKRLWSPHVQIQVSALPPPGHYAQEEMVAVAEPCLSSCEMCQ